MVTYHEENQQNINMFLDMSAAFDCVRHSTLKMKMEMYKFSEETVNLLDSYLSHRSQYVEISGQSSNICWMRQGVPQGSNLGPFLFNLYTQEIGLVSSIDCNHSATLNNDGIL